MDEANSVVLDSLIGRSITDWHKGDDGMHLRLDDGRVAIFAGIFVIAILEPDEQVLH